MSSLRPLDLVARALEAPLRIGHSLEPLDALVVLGAPLHPSGARSQILAERVAAAAALSRRTAAGDQGFSRGIV